MDGLIIRSETVADYEAVGELVKEAFAGMPESDHGEHLLVERLRGCDAYIPELSLVAVLDGAIVGHIMLSLITVYGIYPSLALAPVSVLPSYKGRGIGSELIREAHRRAAEAGHGSVILLGHKDYYPRFGYRPLSEFGIRLPFDVPGEYCMGIELQKDALKDASGIVVYPEEFF